MKYLRPAPEGEELIVDCEVSNTRGYPHYIHTYLYLVPTRHQVIHVGLRLASIKGTLKRARDGAVICTCEQDAANINVPEDSKL